MSLYIYCTVLYSVLYIHIKYCTTSRALQIPQTRESSFQNSCRACSTRASLSLSAIQCTSSFFHANPLGSTCTAKFHPAQVSDRLLYFSQIPESCHWPQNATNPEGQVITVLVLYCRPRGGDWRSLALPYATHCMNLRPHEYCTCTVLQS